MSAKDNLRAGGNVSTVGENSGDRTREAVHLSVCRNRQEREGGHTSREEKSGDRAEHRRNEGRGGEIQKDRPGILDGKTMKLPYG